MERLSLRTAGLALVAALALQLAGCGGGSAADPAANEGGSTPPPPPTTTAYSADQRSEITGRVALQYEDLLAAGVADPRQALRDWAARQPEFSEAGLEEGSLWARFTDGRYFVYILNASTLKWPQPPEPPLDPLAAAPTMQPLAATAAAAAASALEVPRSNRAVFLRMQAEEFDNADGAMRRMGAALTKRGWRVSSGLISLDGLKNGVGEAGLFFMTTHATALGTEAQGKRYAFMTDTTVTDVNDMVWQSDLIDGSIVYTRERNMMARLIGIDRHLLGPPHYAATPKFVRKYMKLAPHSLAILAMCNAGTAANADMPQAFRDANAGAVMAWDGFSNPIGYRTPEALIDRMTGANARVPTDFETALEPTAVPQRAFHRADVWAFLEKKGLTAQRGLDGHEPAHIKLIGDDFQLTNPVITHLQMTGRDRLMIYGWFGTGPFTVTVGGVERFEARRSDDGTTIEVPLPAAAGDPPGTVGEVVVIASAIKSNPRQLVSWRGDLHLIHRTEASNVVYVHDSTVHAHLRGDPHATRDEVDGPLKNNVRMLSLSTDSTIDWEVTTPLACENCTIESGRKTGLQPKFDVDPASPYPPDYSQVLVNPMMFSVDVMQNRLGFGGYVGPNEFYTSQSPGLPPSPGSLRQPDLTKLTQPWDPAQPSGLYGVVPLAFGVGQSVPAGQVEWFEDRGPNNWSHRHTVKWGALDVYPPVDDAVGR